MRFELLQRIAIRAENFGEVGANLAFSHFNFLYLISCKFGQNICLNICHFCRLVTMQYIGQTILERQFHKAVSCRPNIRCISNCPFHNLGHGVLKIEFQVARYKLFLVINAPSSSVKQIIHQALRLKSINNCSIPSPDFIFYSFRKRQNRWTL